MEKRILIISTTVGIGGAGIAVERTLNALNLLEYKIEVESLARSDSGKSILKRRILARLNREFERLSLRKLQKTGSGHKSIARLPFNALGRIDFLKYDIVHIHWANYGFLDFKNIVKIPKEVPVIFTLHSFWPFSYPDHYFTSDKINDIEKLFSATPIIEKICKRINLWILPSEEMKVYLPNDLQSRILNNPLPVNLSKSSLESDRKNYIFIAAGDVFDERKGLIDLLELWISSKMAFSDYELLVVGPINESTYKGAIASRAEVSGVRFIGEVHSSRDIYTLLTLSKAIFVPSYQETFGQVISEAFAAGCPVIARDTIISLGEFEELGSALFKCTYDVESFNSALEWSSNLDIDHKKIAYQASEIFSEKRIAHKLEKIYNEILL